MKDTNVRLNAFALVHYQVAKVRCLRRFFNPHLDGLDQTCSQRCKSGGDHMLNVEAPGSPSVMKFAAAAAVLAVLGGCAVTMPFPPLATSFQDSHDRHHACRTGFKCYETSNSRVAYRRSKPADDGRIYDDPPDFIVNGGDQVDTKRQQ
jgi:hypothetical protein